MIKVLIKYPFISKNLLRKNLKNFKTRNKSTQLIFIFKNYKIFIYNGKNYISLFINSKKLNSKLGHFVFTKNLKKKIFNGT
uniref:30S ribosomal protein S19 n=1 Tax=Nephromyces sp. ex Molgula occidentalis TaxID=2544991 RepID=A0A5C1H8T1_9APIC|nr:30S ribosomal protein S19 [Nephromyces sp. ex Molgula occidentalis]